MGPWAHSPQSSTFSQVGWLNPGDLAPAAERHRPGQAPPWPVAAVVAVVAAAHVVAAGDAAGAGEGEAAEGGEGEVRSLRVQGEGLWVREGV